MAPASDSAGGGAPSPGIGQAYAAHLAQQLAEKGGPHPAGSNAPAFMGNQPTPGSASDQYQNPNAAGQAAAYAGSMAHPSDAQFAANQKPQPGVSQTNKWGLQVDSGGNWAKNQPANSMGFGTNSNGDPVIMDQSKVPIGTAIPSGGSAVWNGTGWFNPHDQNSNEGSLPIGTASPWDPAQKWDGKSFS